MSSVMLSATVKNKEDSLPPPLDSSFAPMLLFDYNDGGAGEPNHAKYMYSIPKRRVLLSKGFESFIRDVLWVTPQGWVLTLSGNDDGSRDVSLCDPFSPGAIELPLDREGLLDINITATCLLSTHRPTDPGCIVVVVHREDPLLFYCRPEDRRWSTHEYQTELICENRDAAIGVMSLLTAVGGRFHGLYGDKLVTLEFSPEPTLTSTYVAPTPWPPMCNQIRYFKVESCGELFLVRFCYAPLDIDRIWRVEVDRLDWSRSAWVKVEGLGVDRAFFVVGWFGTSMAAEEHGLKSNCIYYIHEGDKGLYVYDMEQGTTTMHNTGSNVPDSDEPILLMPII